MGLFGLLKKKHLDKASPTVTPQETVNPSKQVIINGVPVPREIHVAMQLHSTLVVSSRNPDDFDPLTKSIIKQCSNDRSAILLSEIELCAPYETSMSYCIIANAYYFLGAAYRQQTIQYMSKYLKNPEWIPRAEYYEADRERYLSGRWGILGKAYESEYRFEEALQAYQAEREIMPEYPTAYIHIATILSKMNRLDDAIELLNETKNTRYYIEPAFGSCFNTVIDNYLSKFKDKKERGYVYRPRQRKT